MYFVHDLNLLESNSGEMTENDGMESEGMPLNEWQSKEINIINAINK